MTFESGEYTLKLAEKPGAGVYSVELGSSVTGYALSGAISVTVEE